MSSNKPVAIVACELGKRYALGATRHDTLRDTMSHFMSRSWRNWWRSKSPRPNMQGSFASRVAQGLAPMDAARSGFWALRDVSFAIDRGDVVGIVGSNGAGKSTLLKLLTRITRPTQGSLTVWGRVGSLLEVGTGFHPELSGRENIFLSGAILGMKRAEIRRKFDQIVEFADITPFLDTPVKRYSSGMYVRLGFAVAAHLEPDSLVVDEVLAVGDTTFQRKCLAFIQELARNGTTILLVSHNMSTIQSTCRSALLLQRGRLIDSGAANQVVQAYLRAMEWSSGTRLSERHDRSGLGGTRINSLQVVGCYHVQGLLATGRSCEFRFEVSQGLPGMSCEFSICDSSGTPITSFDSANLAPSDHLQQLPVATTPVHFSCRIDQLPLMAGRYHLNAGLYVNGQLHDHIDGAAFFDVEVGALAGRSAPDVVGFGAVAVPHAWQSQV